MLRQENLRKNLRDRLALSALPSGGGGCAAHRPSRQKERKQSAGQCKYVVTAQMKALCAKVRALCQERPAEGAGMWCRHVARKAVQPPTTRSMATRKNKARCAAKGHVQTQPQKAFQKPVHHVPRLSKIKVPEVLGRQNSPRRRPRQSK